jgi:hypothetical protein
MKILPDGWRIHEAREPERELRRLQGRFRAVSRRYDRAIRLRRFYRRAKVWAFVGIAVVALSSELASLSPWPLMLRLRHIASYPNCNAARAVGLAPAKKGEPGYWPHLDADADGISCEPWPHR